jgi:DNA-binding FadR family transcriptional regulator
MSLRAPPMSVFAQVPNLRAEIGRRTVRERISDKLASLIASGILQVGEELPSERDLAALLAVSRETVNSYELESVHKSRLLIERAVAAEAAVRIDDSTLGRLEQSLAIQKQTMHDPVHFLICDREFHLTIYRSCGNPLLADFVADLYTFMLDHRRIAVSQPGAIEKSYLDHVAIFKALSAHDPQAATDAIGRHIDRIYATTVEILADKPKPKKSA